VNAHCVSQACALDIGNAERETAEALVLSDVKRAVVLEIIARFHWLAR